MSSPVPAEPVRPPMSAVGAATPDAAAEAPGGPSTVRPATVGARLCANCGAPLGGNFCSECGQRHHDHPVHDFWHFVNEALEDLTHADSRLWQTILALLFRPGFLTREFLDGRRVRYLPPVRLYLVISVIFFVIAGLSSRISNPQVILSDNGGSFHYQVVPADKAGGLGPADRTPDRLAGGVAVVAPTPAARRQLCEQLKGFLEQYGGRFARFAPDMTQSCLAASAEGGLERLSEAVTHNLERAMFLFLPLLALVMKPLYLKPPRHYVEHLLFFLHTHAFLFVMLAASSLLKMMTSSAAVLNSIGTAIAIYIPIYFYLAMRRVYGQGRWLTLSKLAALGVAYFSLGVVMLLATVFYSFLML
jgi:hypothetical protein